MLKVVLDTASRTVELALQSDQYTAEQIMLLLRQANRVSSRDRDRLACSSKVSKFFLDVLLNKTKLPANSFFKLLGLLLADQGIKLILDEQVQYQIFGSNCDDHEKEGSLLIGPSLATFIPSIMDVLCERDFKFLAIGNDKREMSSSSTQTPSMIMSSNGLFGDRIEVIFYFSVFSSINYQHLKKCYAEHVNC